MDLTLRVEHACRQKHADDPRHGADIDDDTTTSTVDVDRQHGCYNTSLLLLSSAAAASGVQLTVHHRTNQSMTNAQRSSSASSSCYRHKNGTAAGLAVGTLAVGTQPVELSRLLHLLEFNTALAYF